MIVQVPSIVQEKGTSSEWHVEEQRVTVFTAVRAERAPELMEISILTLQKEKWNSREKRAFAQDLVLLLCSLLLNHIKQEGRWAVSLLIRCSS